MKKKVFSLALVICCLSVFIASSTLAYFTKEDTATNVITTGKIDIELSEVTLEIDPETNTPKEFENLTDVMPGQEVDKIVTVKNINNAQPAFVRVKVEPDIQLAEGVEEDNRDDLVVEIMPLDVDLDVFGVDFNFDYWTFGNDGYIYYNEVLGTGKETQPLFTKVMFDPQMGNMYQGATFTITIDAQAVQAVNIKDSDGNPVTQAIDVPENVWPVLGAEF